MYSSFPLVNNFFFSVSSFSIFPVNTSCLFSVESSSSLFRSLNCFRKSSCIARICSTSVSSAALSVSSVVFSVSKTHTCFSKPGTCSATVVVSSKFFSNAKTCVLKCWVVSSCGCSVSFCVAICACSRDAWIFLTSLRACTAAASASCARLLSVRLEFFDSFNWVSISSTFSCNLFPFEDSCSSCCFRLRIVSSNPETLESISWLSPEDRVAVLLFVSFVCLASVLYFCCRARNLLTASRNFPKILSFVSTTSTSSLRSAISV